MKFLPQKTEDGSYTFFSDEFSEAFHSVYGAKNEAEIKFVIPTNLRSIAQKKSQIKLLDICYGLGYNSAAALETIWQVNPKCHVELIALEIAADVPQNAISHNLLTSWPTPIPQLLATLAFKFQVKHHLLSAQLLLGDARQTIQQLCQQTWQADAIFLDPFSPPKCPQLWTVEFIALTAKCLKPTGRLATYSCAAAVRTALSMAGLKYGSTPGMGRKSPGTVASFDLRDLDLPSLSLQEKEHLQTRAAIPYQDIYLSNSAEEIKAQRQQKQALSSLGSTSQWKKRWQKLCWRNELNQ
jgi:tRNA U34 5-methylaminomethyl-2-thiouridine-forming methyltransferase MnmC